MEKEKRSYYVNVIEAKEGKMKEVMGFNFCGHHDLCAMAGKVKESGLVEKDKHAQELVLGIRLLHHVMKKYPDCDLFKSFEHQFKAFKDAFKEKAGCCCGCDRQESSD